MNYKVTTQDLIGDIADFPIEIVQKMVDRQIEQQGVDNVSVFQYDRTSAINGFNYEITTEGKDFWSQVCVYKNFDLFFERYPIVNSISEIFATTPVGPPNGIVPLDIPYIDHNKTTGIIK